MDIIRPSEANLRDNQCMCSQILRIKQILASLDQVFSRKTVRGFVEPVRAVEDLDPVIQQALTPYLDRVDPPLQILIAPAQTVLVERSLKSWWPRSLLPWEITPDHTVLLTARRLLVVSILHSLEPTPGDPILPPEVLAIPLRSVLFSEFSSILLRSWFEVIWVNAGWLEHTRIYFNAVGKDHFERLAQRLRLSLLQAGGLGPTLDASRAQQAQALANLPYKFKSLIFAHLLLPGEAVEQADFFPAHKGHGRLQAAQALVMLRTSAHWIIAQEEASPDQTNYGLITCFYPRRYLRRAAGPDPVLALEGVEYPLPLPPELRATNLSAG